MNGDKMNILITGGAGSLGTALVNEIQKNECEEIPINTIRILDNNEHALATMKIPYPSLVRKLHGSITDKDRVKRAVHEVDIVIHCAAMKNLEITEYNVSELIKTNVVGTDNIIGSSVEAGVKKIVFISSDKAVEPISIYGASKLIGEHTALNYNQTSYPNSKVSVFRSGNFRNSNGNVFEIWKQQKESGIPLTVTDFNCRRYFIHTHIAASIIVKCISKMNGGEIFIPIRNIMPELSILSMAKEYSPNSKIEITGLRKNEKLKEILMTPEEQTKVIENKKLSCWVIK